MKKLIVIIYLLASIPQIGLAQNNSDTLTVDLISRLCTITEIFTLPHERYKLDHFVFVHMTKKMNPMVRYNKGEILSDASKGFLKRLGSGDTLLIKEVYALNTLSPEAGLVKLKGKRIILK